MAFVKNIIKGAGNRSFFSGKTKKIAIISITLIIIISYGLFFYLQTATENDIKTASLSSKDNAR
jgi:hypothetical protein